MSVLIDTVGEITGGLGSGRKMVWVGNVAWAFAFDGTQTLASYYSPDLVNWYPGATHSLLNAHLGEGRNLSVGHAILSGVDVIWVAITYQVATTLGVNMIRATVSGTTLTWHTTETLIGTPTTDGDALYWAGASVMFDSNNRIHLANSFAGPGTGGNGDVVANRSSIDAGGPEQQTALTWPNGYVIDSSVTAENRSMYLFSRGSGLAALINDDGSAANTTTGLDYHTFNGSAWNIDNTNGKVTGGQITAIDKNDWGAVELSTSAAHAVYRSAVGALVHRVWAGATWGAGDVIPALTTNSGTGIALASDGTTVYLVVIANDNSIQCISWRSGGWDLAWTLLEGSATAKTFVSCAKDVASGNFLVCWHEGQNLMSTYFNPGGPTYLAYYPYWFNALRVM